MTKKNIVFGLILLVLTACSHDKGAIVPSVNTKITARANGNVPQPVANGTSTDPAQPSSSPSEPLVLAKEQHYNLQEGESTLSHERTFFYNPEGNILEELVDQNGDGNTDFFFSHRYNDAGLLTSKSRFDGRIREGGPKWRQRWEYESDGRPKSVRTDNDGDENYDFQETYLYRSDGTHRVTQIYDGEDNGSAHDVGDYRDLKEYDVNGLLARVLSYREDGHGVTELYSESLRTYDDQKRIIELRQNLDVDPDPDAEIEWDYVERWSYEEIPLQNGGVQKTTDWHIAVGGNDSHRTTELFNKDGKLTQKSIIERIDNRDHDSMTSMEKFIYTREGWLRRHTKDVLQREIEWQARYQRAFKKEWTYNKEGKMIQEVDEYDMNGDGIIDKRIVFDYQPLSKALSRRAVD